MNKFLLGSGELDWRAFERRSDRYGTVMLLQGEETVRLGNHELEGHRGRLVARVLEARKSHHVGDLAREISPSIPQVGEIIVLGEGELFFEHIGGDHEPSWAEIVDQRYMEILAELLETSVVAPNQWKPSRAHDIVGLRPLDGRATDWLDPRKLYRTHAQTVSLYFQRDACD